MFIPVFSAVLFVLMPGCVGYYKGYDGTQLMCQFRTDGDKQAVIH
jgi:hypothetical protein